MSPAPLGWRRPVARPEQEPNSTARSALHQQYVHADCVAVQHRDGFIDPSATTRIGTCEGHGDRWPQPPWLSRHSSDLARSAQLPRSADCQEQAYPYPRSSHSNRYVPRSTSLPSATRLTYRRTNHDNFHVRGYKEEGTITTPFDMTVLNDLDRFHLVMDTIDRLPQTGDKGIYLKQQLWDKLIGHKQYIDKYGQDLPEIRYWKWNAGS